MYYFALLGCTHFAEILLARQFVHKRCSFISHRPFIVESCNSCRVDGQFVHKRCSFISHRPFIVESCNSCHMDGQFVHVQVENVNISAKRALPYVSPSRRRRRSVSIAIIFSDYPHV